MCIAEDRVGGCPSHREIDGTGVSDETKVDREMTGWQFDDRKRIGKPPIGDRAMTGAERMAKWRRNMRAVLPVGRPTCLSRQR